MHSASRACRSSTPVVRASDVSTTWSSLGDVAIRVDQRRRLLHLITCGGVLIILASGSRVIIIVQWRVVIVVVFHFLLHESG